MKSDVIINTGIRFGKPIIAGTRIAVEDILNFIKNGMTVDEIIFDFPEITKQQIQACIDYKFSQL